MANKCEFWELQTCKAYASVTRNEVLEIVHKLYRKNVSHFCSDTAELSNCDFASFLVSYAGTLVELIKWLAGITIRIDFL